MNYKLTTTLIIVQLMAYTAPQKPIADNNYDKFEYNCKSILSSMHFLFNQRCVQFIFGHELDSVECMKNIMENSENVTFYVRSLSWLFNRNVYVEELLENEDNKKSTRHCENFLIVLKDLSSLQTVINSVENNASAVTIFPYSKLYFMFADKKFQFLPSRMWTQISKFFYENAQFGFVYEFDAVTKTLKLRDLLSLDVESDPTIIRSNLIHPIVNRENNQKEFRLSFYNCSPFIIYVDEKSLRFGGVEYRLIKEVTKNWKIKHLLRDQSKTGISPWVTMFDDLKNHTADVAMCSVWISVFDNKYDVSSYYNHECDTLLVPKPARLSEITAIYKTLSGQVWFTFGLFFVATGILLRSNAMIGIVKKTVYVDLSRTFLEVMNIATSHSANIFRTQPGSIKILLMSWTLACTIVGICYTTVYTSRLTKPGYTKIIDTVDDFIENDMFWGTLQSVDAYSDIIASLNASANPAYQELIRRIKFFKNHDEADSGLASGKIGVYGGFTNDKYFVTYNEWNHKLNLLSSMRLMKKACIFNYYTVFALQKFSPYTELFSFYALQFQEHGITQFWFRTVYRGKVWLETFLEDYPKENNEPMALHFSSISSALFVLFVSHILSVIVFTCEFSIKYFTRPRCLALAENV